MKKLTRKIVALTLSLVMCISFSNTTFAYADNENISSSAEASKVNEKSNPPAMLGRIE